MYELMSCLYNKYKANDTFIDQLRWVYVTVNAYDLYNI